MVTLSPTYSRGTRFLAPSVVNLTLRFFISITLHNALDGFDDVSDVSIGEGTITPLDVIVLLKYFFQVNVGGRKAILCEVGGEVQKHRDNLIFVTEVYTLSFSRVFFVRLSKEPFDRHSEVISKCYHNICFRLLVSADIPTKGNRVNPYTMRHLLLQHPGFAD